MKKIVFNDGKTTEIQSVKEQDNVLHVRLILTTSEQLKALFADEFATSKMIVTENGKQENVFENYTKLSYIKEESGGIWEVEMLQTEASMAYRIEKLERMTEQNTMAIDMAIAELTLAMVASGGEIDV